MSSKVKNKSKKASKRFARKRGLNGVINNLSAKRDGMISAKRGFGLGIAL